MRSNCANSLLAKRCLKDGRELAAFLGKQREVALRAADITGKNHQSPAKI